MNIVLVGYRGCGKSSVGRKLADRLWRAFVDVDEMIVRKAGKTIKAIFEEEGEPWFRDLEAQVVHDIMQLDDQVVALGGGTLMFEKNRQTIEQADAKVIYLRCDADVLCQRIQCDPASAATRPESHRTGRRH